MKPKNNLDGTLEIPKEVVDAFIATHTHLGAGWFVSVKKSTLNENGSLSVDYSASTEGVPVNPGLRNLGPVPTPQ